MPGLGYGPKGFYMFQPDPYNPNNNKLVYYSSDTEVEQSGNLAVSFHDDVIKPISWWSSSWVEKIFR